MRRLSLLVVSGMIVAAAYALSAPVTEDPDPGVPTTVSEEVVRISRFFHCPWAFADDTSTSSHAVLATVESDFGVSYVENGDVELGESGRLRGGAGASVPNPRVLGASSAIVELSNGPAAAGVVAIGPDLLAGDVCSGSLPAMWHVPGGSTREGDVLTLRLFNPFADDAQVSVSAVSELGTEADDSFENVAIPARSTRTFALHETLPGREALSVFVEQIEGSVIPVMVQEAAGDVAVWPGTRHSELWEFPVATAEGVSTELVLTNIAPIEVAFTVEVFDETATVLTSVSGVIEGPGQTRVPLNGIESGAFGIRLTGDGPLGAVVVGRGETSAVGTIGASGVSDEWLVPGPNSEGGAVYSLWFLNTGAELVTVEYRMVDEVGADSEGSVTVAAGAVASVDATAVGTSGVVVSASAPISVAWSGEFEGRRMFGGAVPIGE